MKSLFGSSKKKAVVRQDAGWRPAPSGPQSNSVMAPRGQPSGHYTNARGQGISPNVLVVGIDFGISACHGVLTTGTTHTGIRGVDCAH
jgi:hypothetical protein